MRGRRTSPPGKHSHVASYTELQDRRESNYEEAKYLHSHCSFVSPAQVGFKPLLVATTYGARWGTSPGRAPPGFIDKNLILHSWLGVVLSALSVLSVLRNKAIVLFLCHIPLGRLASLLNTSMLQSHNKSVVRQDSHSVWS